MMSQIAGVSVICSTICSDADQGKHQGSASLTFVKGIHRWWVVPVKRASNAENVSIWWGPHVVVSSSRLEMHLHQTTLDHQQAQCGQDKFQRYYIQEILMIFLCPTCAQYNCSNVTNLYSVISEQTCNLTRMFVLSITTHDISIVWYQVGVWTSKRVNCFELSSWSWPDEIIATECWEAKCI